VVFQLKLVDKKSKEAEFAKSSLFSKHVEMKGKYKNLYISDTSGFQSLSTCCQCHLFSISNLSATNYTDLYIYIYILVGWQTGLRITTSSSSSYKLRIYF